MNNGSDSSSQMYSLDEVAKRLGVHRATVSRYISRGDLRVVRLGHRTVRVTREAFMDFVHQHEARDGDEQ